MIVANLDPSIPSQLTIRLFRNVENTSELHKKLSSGQLQCCCVNPKLVLDPFQLIVAANKAMCTENRTTKSVFTEILFNLSISKNITRSLQQFGINSDCREMLVLTISDEGQNNDDVTSEIKGQEVSLEELTQIQDLTAIKKAYKIGTDEEKTAKLLDSVVSRIATKDFISH